MEEILEFLLQYGYVILILFSFTGGYFGMIAAGFLVSLGKMDLTLVLIITSVSNFLGDYLLFTYVSFIKKFFKKDYRRIIKRYSRKVAYTKVLIRKKGVYGMFMQKYIKIVRTLYPIVLATMGYNKKKFFILNIFASISWSVSIILPSYFFAPYIMGLFK